MTIAVVDYGSGNLRSVAKSFERAAKGIGNSTRIEVTDDPATVGKADRIVLPGVGAFSDCRRGLFKIDGMMESLNQAVIGKGRPFLGICVGMQLMASRGCEHETEAGFGWIPGEVGMLEPDDASLKVPHMGWNTVNAVQKHPLLSGMSVGESGQHAYFVHSYNFRVENPDHLLATFDYSGTFTAIVGRDNLVGTQFHPEKSQKFGLQLISNFLNWSP